MKANGRARIAEVTRVKVGDDQPIHETARLTNWHDACVDAETASVVDARAQTTSGQDATTSS